ncbi:hypothetical protein THAOC_03156, partial [Thalassiosira oceanica]
MGPPRVSTSTTKALKCRGMRRTAPSPGPGCLSSLFARHDAQFLLILEDAFHRLQWTGVGYDAVNVDALLMGAAVVLPLSSFLIFGPELRNSAGNRKAYRNMGQANATGDPTSLLEPVARPSTRGSRVENRKMGRRWADGDGVMADYLHQRTTMRSKLPLRTFVLLLIVVPAHGFCGPARVKSSDLASAVSCAGDHRRAGGKTACAAAPLRAGANLRHKGAHGPVQSRRRKRLAASPVDEVEEDTTARNEIRNIVNDVSRQTLSSLLSQSDVERIYNELFFERSSVLFNDETYQQYKKYWSKAETRLRQEDKRTLSDLLGEGGDKQNPEFHTG